MVSCRDIAMIGESRYNSISVVMYSRLPNLSFYVRFVRMGYTFNLLQRHSLSLGWIVDPLKPPPSSSRPRTPGSQSGNRGSNPLGGIGMLAASCMNLQGAVFLGFLILAANSCNPFPACAGPFFGPLKNMN